MTKPATIFLGLAASLLAGHSALAAGTDTIYGGGLGQVVGDTQTFGVAICNGTAQTLAQPVPVSLTGNGHAAGISSAAPIAPGTCEYSYLAYSDLGLRPGKTYSILVKVDDDQRDTYFVTVPFADTASAPDRTIGTAQAATQAGNFFSMLSAWFSTLFRPQ